MPGATADPDFALRPKAGREEEKESGVTPHPAYGATAKATPSTGTASDKPSAASADTSATDTSDADTSDADTSDADTSDADTSDADTSSVGKPSTKKSSADKASDPFGGFGSGMSGSARYLREEDRIHIADRLRENASIRQIAAELGRSPSTISREIRRNGALRRGKDWVYRPHAAHRRAEQRRPRPKAGKIGQCTELRDFIQHHLERRWSPEQICQALRTAFPDRPEMHVVHETIYQAPYVQGRGELRRELAKALRTGRAMRRPHRQSYRRQPRMAQDMVMISEGPPRPQTARSPGTGRATVRHDAARI